MLRERVFRNSQAAMVVGWVSNTDAIFLGLIFTLAVTLVAVARLQKSERKNSQMQGAAEELQVQLGQTQEEVDGLQAQLGQRHTQLAELQAERDRLTQDNRRLSGIAAQVPPLGTERDKLTASLSSAMQESKRLATENEELTAKLAACRDYFATMRKTLEQTTAEKQDASIRLVAATEERDRAQRESGALRSQIAAEPGLHKELIGLKGPLRRVAIVFDTSGSMAQSGRWEQARAVVAAWLEHLAISECVLVLFSNDARVFPDDGSFLDMRGRGGAANRRSLLEHIRATKPEGGTNTLLALQMAYRCANLDTVILFTDGEPNNPANLGTNQFDPQVAEAIYALCEQHKQIPVNTVGLGDYFKPQLSAFLMRVAQGTGGNFLGR